MAERTGRDRKTAVSSMGREMSEKTDRNGETAVSSMGREMSEKTGRNRETAVSSMGREMSEKTGRNRETAERTSMDREMEIDMRIENMKQEFPGMPEQMRAMVEREVEKQLKQTSVSQYRKGKRMARKSMIAAMVAVMALGTTVFAGVTYRMRSTGRGTYGVDIGMEAPEGVQATEAQEAMNPAEIPPVKLEVGYIPQGMVQLEGEPAKYSYESAMYKGGVSMDLFRMDTGVDKFEMSFDNVIAREDITVNGYSGVYIEFAQMYENEISFNQRIYVAYPDVHYVLEMYVASDVTKDEALKMAEGIRLVPTTESEAAACISGYDWSEYVKTLAGVEYEYADEGFSMVVSKDQMANTHVVGESFVQKDPGSEAAESMVSMKVTDVAVYDDVSVLDLSALDSDEREELQKETDADGRLLPATYDYWKSGDGVNSVDELVSSREVPQKLVYVTVEYTNTGSETLNELLFWGNLLRLTEDGDQVRFYEETPAAGDSWDQVVTKNLCRLCEMFYYDVHGGERGNNYISSIQPGETKTVHMAWVVAEDELPYLYLNLDTFGGAYEFSENALATGYVDIRQ